MWKLRTMVPPSFGQQESFFLVVACFAIFGGASVLASRLVSSLAPPNCTASFFFILTSRFWPDFMAWVRQRRSPDIGFGCRRVLISGSRPVSGPGAVHPAAIAA